MASIHVMSLFSFSPDVKEVMRRPRDIVITLKRPVNWCQRSQRRMYSQITAEEDSNDKKLAAELHR